ncbi:hypothetical protein ABZ349_29865 [Streptomyces niveus]|uniref:hypothetical protein n=1 Tax=Streptomyces niveus TaxID=193462 RepID=UPI003001268D
MSGTSRIRPPTQYADTTPSGSASITASGPFSNCRSTVAGPVAKVAFADAFFGAGRRDDDVGLVALAAGRTDADGSRQVPAEVPAMRNPPRTSR